jgi:hypothetical protein
VQGAAVSDSRIVFSEPLRGSNCRALVDFGFDPAGDYMVAVDDEGNVHGLAVLKTGEVFATLAGFGYEPDTGEFQSYLPEVTP